MKTRMWIFFITIMAFFVPLGAIVAIEKSKQEKQLAQKKDEYLFEKQALDDIRAAYLRDAEERKNELKRTMEESKAQYEALLKNQPGIIAKHQKAVTKTTMVPVETKQAVESSSSAKSSSKTTSSSKPKATTTTKTS